MMLATKENITGYIPQRFPMVMIDDLVETTQEYTITRFLIESDNVFFEDGYLGEPGLVENIAQTAAVHMGYQCWAKKIPVPIGYIVAVKDLRILELPKENEVITTSIRITNRVLDVTVAEGKIEKDGKVVCSCEMRIFVKVQL